MIPALSKITFSFQVLLSSLRCLNVNRYIWDLYPSSVPDYSSSSLFSFRFNLFFKQFLDPSDTTPSVPSNFHLRSTLIPSHFILTSLPVIFSWCCFSIPFVEVLYKFIFSCFPVIFDFHFSLSGGWILTDPRFHSSFKLTGRDILSNHDGEW